MATNHRADVLASCSQDNSVACLSFSLSGSQQLFCLPSLPKLLICWRLPYREGTVVRDFPGRGHWVLAGWSLIQLSISCSHWNEYIRQWGWGGGYVGVGGGQLFFLFHLCDVWIFRGLGAQTRRVCLAPGLFIYLFINFKNFYWSIVALLYVSTQKLMFCQFLLYSKVNQLYVYIYPLFFGFSSHLGHHSALSRDPCAIQYVLISYLFDTQYQQCICVPNL